jgi:general stress protein YciG
VHPVRHEQIAREITQPGGPKSGSTSIAREITQPGGPKSGSTSIAREITQPGGPKSGSTSQADTLPVALASVVMIVLI